MRYKAGDTVKIKTWKQMESEFGLDNGRDIRCVPPFSQLMEKKLN